MFTPAKQTKRFFKVALWGPMKVGKTCAALSFPSPCVVDGERGSLLYADRYSFDVRDANHWSELLEAVKFLESGKHQYKTLVVDPLTVYWQDLMDQQVQYAANRRGNEVLTPGDWGILKRRWKSLMNRLVDLDMHVVLCMRAKDEYEQSVDPRTGEDRSRKTGELTADAERGTDYFFDVILRCYTEEDKKKGVCRHLVRVDGSRIAEVAKYSTHDITGKRLYDVLFRPLEGKYLAGSPAVPRPKTEELPRPVPPLPSHVEAVGEILSFVPAPEGPKATAEDIKVLMTRAGQLRWPDGSKFTSSQGKAMIRGLYKVESSKELTKGQVDFLYNEFGLVLAGRAELALDEKGIPYVARKSDIDVSVTNETSF